MDNILCPHCGAENIKSSIITTCTRCLNSLKGGKTAPTEPAAPPLTLPSSGPDADAGDASPVASDEPVATMDRRSAADDLTQTRPLRDRMSDSNASSGCGCAVFAGIAAGVVSSWVFHIGKLASSGIGLLTFAVVASGIALVYRFIAQIAGSYYDATFEGVPDRVMPGQSFEAGVRIRAKRQMQLGDARAVLECEEHAISRGGTSDSHYRKNVLEREFPLDAGRRLMAGEEAVLRAKITIPVAAVPTLRARNNFIEWKLKLIVPVPGYCPDIRDEFQFAVAPVMAHGSSRSVAKDPSMPQQWLDEVQVRDKRSEIRGVQAELEAVDGTTVQGMPAMSVAATRRLNLTVRADEDIHCRGVQCWVGCRIHGSGTAEDVALEAEHIILEGDFGPGHPISHAITVSIPSGGPVSFIGRYVKCAWMVRVRVDIPVWRDKRIELPFVVTPELIAEPD
jgi:hypothetical protein